MDDGSIKHTVNLIPNGDKVNVTNDNKEEYVRLMLQYHYIRRQIAAHEITSSAFHALIPASLVARFVTHTELRYHLKV